MATSRANPARTLVVFLLATALAYGLVALIDTWQPRLGLDLQGGTRITLTAEGEPSTADLEETREVVETRADDSGVDNAEVVTQDDHSVLVEVPGELSPGLVATLQRRGEMRLRLVATSGPGAPAAGQSSRAPLAWAATEESPEPSPSQAPSDSPDQSPTDGGDVEPLVWVNNPDQESMTAFDQFSCATQDQAAVEDDADQPLVTCGRDGQKYLLSAAVVSGADLDSADSRAPNQQSDDWAVTLDFDGTGTQEFTEMSRALAGTTKRFAVVLDGQVISAPTMNSVITNGQAEITGGFSQAEAEGLATSLSSGALPIAFEADPPAASVGPSLGGDQLRAAVTALVVGLVLVMLYLLARYRALGGVVTASLLMTAALAYPLVVLLGEAFGLTITLPALAGLLVAFGMAADSSISHVERIRDVLAEGTSLGVAVDAGWEQARNTKLAASGVVLLAAVVLLVFATGVVDGFAMLLGVAALVDLAVFFWFTHPLVGVLAEQRLFRGRHPLSGVSRDSLEVAR